MGSYFSGDSHDWVARRLLETACAISNYFRGEPICSRHKVGHFPRRKALGRFRLGKEPGQSAAIPRAARMILTRSVSEEHKSFPRLRFGLV